jgi:hypothetical protein
VLNNFFVKGAMKIRGYENHNCIKAKFILNGMAQFHCRARKIHEHPTCGEGGYLWIFSLPQR